MKRILLVCTGAPPAAIAARWGAFDAWFERLIGGRAEVERADARAPLPAVGGFDGAILTGSLDSVTAWAPWMQATAAWALAAARSRPVLGVCFGHQLLARALGARVERRPAGPEAGTVEVALTAAGRADPLFRGLPPRLAVQEAHEDHVASVPRGAIVLARSERTPIQAFAVGDAIRGVQFHPEVDAGRCRALAEWSRAALDGRAAGGCSAAIGSIRETPEAERVLEAWLSAFVGA
ncbi:glutamine amidotransferase class-I [Anaeromyxobacter sp. K]|uniref:glutamine amidotransferase-related protein n=1 Tax=Anaeromyxobacter sp. (strain K) TaxID=447217 RepID=UPI00015F93DE|nr:gamma-glutamyl-gamma-aminobutyrate hydrolase family protein [Anaeromyxobacter sp. K]ACG74832.1 glutamine amidotransferase class-I [Anaeromyxobacter sp. K]